MARIYAPLAAEFEVDDNNGITRTVAEVHEHEPFLVPARFEGDSLAGQPMGVSVELRAGGRFYSYGELHVCKHCGAIYCGAVVVPATQPKEG